jgi:hypothetical protein
MISLIYWFGAPQWASHSRRLQVVWLHRKQLPLAHGKPLLVLKDAQDVLASSRAFALVLPFLAPQPKLRSPTKSTAAQRKQETSLT